MKRETSPSYKIGMYAEVLGASWENLHKTVRQYIALVSRFERSARFVFAEVVGSHAGLRGWQVSPEKARQYLCSLSSLRSGKWRNGTGRSPDVHW